MKVWKFYKLPSEPYDELPKLYAITGIKEYADTFRDMRNMSLFKEVKGEMDKEEFNSLIRSNRDYYLDTFSIYTSKVNNKGAYTEYKLDMLLTTYEYNSVMEEMDLIADSIDGMNWYYIKSLSMFKGKILDALKVLSYDTLFMYYSVTEEFENLDDYPIPEYDNYYILMLMFGSTFK